MCAHYLAVCGCVQSGVANTGPSVLGKCPTRILRWVCHATLQSLPNHGLNPVSCVSCLPWFFTTEEVPGRWKQKPECSGFNIHVILSFSFLHSISSYLWHEDLCFLLQRTSSSVGQALSCGVVSSSQPGMDPGLPVQEHGRVLSHRT